MSSGEGAVEKKLEREPREEEEVLFRKDIRVSRSRRFVFKDVTLDPQ